MSQKIDISSSSNVKKPERFSLFFHDYFSRIHKIKTRTYKKNLRHVSLYINVFYKYVKFYV